MLKLPSQICRIRKCIYSKCSKVLDTFLTLFSIKFLGIKAAIHKLLVRIANREDPDHTASSEVHKSDQGLHCFGRQLVFEI